MPTLSALQGAQATAAAIVRADGVRGLYRGFGTTIFGLVPARGVSIWGFLAVQVVLLWGED